MTNTIDYNHYMRRAMQHMISEILSEVAENGLPGAHHFYISFLTGAKGVDIPAHLRASYPEEMTIVLQEWFDNLAVMDDDRFAVTLSFHGKAENLVIPFSAMTGFADPSVQFQLRFDAVDEYEEEEIEEVDAEEEAEPTDAEVIQLDAFRKPKSPAE